MQIQRVLSSAKLKNIQATKKSRTDLAKSIRHNFENFVNQTLESKNFLTLSDTIGYYKANFPDINIGVKKLTRKNCIAYLDIKYDSQEKNSIIGYCVEAPFKWNKIKKENSDGLKSLAHENEHFNIYTIFPKYTVQWTKGKLSNTVFKNQVKFFDDFIYNDEIKGSKNEKKLRNNKKLRSEIFKNEITKYFIRKGYSPEEKIDILRRWRYYIKEEMQAYKIGSETFAKNTFPIKKLTKELKKQQSLKLEHKINTQKIIYFNSEDYKTVSEQIKNLKAFIIRVKKHKYAEIVNKRCMFPEKLNTIESLLLNEITTERNKLKMLYA